MTADGDFEGLDSFPHLTLRNKRRFVTARTIQRMLSILRKDSHSQGDSTEQHQREEVAVPKR
jgi:hypothetical protein